MKKSNILCQRIWLKKNQNSIDHLRMHSDGFSIEIDIRDYNSKLIVSHDPPTGLDKYMSFDLYSTFTMN